MATAASKILTRASRSLQDAGGVRWPELTLLDWLNAGQREILVVRPDACNLGAELTLAAGVRQQLPTNGVKLLNVSHNTGANAGLAAITPCERSMLDAYTPGWRNGIQRGVVQHTMYDAMEPRFFDVYPPALAGTKVFANYAATPADLTMANQNINVADTWENALLDYVLFRAFSMDAEAADATQRALAHLQLFNGTTGAEIKATAGVSPRNTKNAAETAQ